MDRIDRSLRTAFFLVLAFLGSVSTFAQALATTGGAAPVPLEPVETVPVCAGVPGQLPRPNDPVGSPDTKNPIEHIIVIMQENHSFDEYFGRLNVAGYGNEVDGLSLDMANFDARGRRVPVYHHDGFCAKDTDHGWDGLHREWNLGKNDGFVRTNGMRVMGYFEQRDLPVYYALANRFAIGDRYFASMMGPTHPNRLYTWAGTSLGVVKTSPFTSFPSKTAKTIFDLLNENKISWRYYAENDGYLGLLHRVWKQNRRKISPIAQFAADLKGDALPQVIFLDSPEDVADEHAPQDVRVGQSWVTRQVNAFFKSKYWKNSVIFFTYDENGGNFDHVPPPRACAPDSIAPKTGKVTPEGSGFDRLGFRVPFVVISAYAKTHYVSHRVADHTSILRFIESKFNLPALTRRDANADDLMDFFDFSNPNFALPALPAAPPADPECLPWGQDGE